MVPVPIARAFRFPIIAAISALALSGCMRTPGPVAVVPPPSDLDAMAYGAPNNPGQPGAASPRSASADSGGAISALRASFAASSQRSSAPYAPAQAAYAAAPMPAPAYDAAYRLDAGDKLRVVVYGQ